MSKRTPLATAQRRPPPTYPPKRPIAANPVHWPCFAMFNRRDTTRNQRKTSTRLTPRAAPRPLLKPPNPPDSGLVRPAVSRVGLPAVSQKLDRPRCRLTATVLGGSARVSILSRGKISFKSPSCGSPPVSPSALRGGRALAGLAHVRGGDEWGEWRYSPARPVPTPLHPIKPPFLRSLSVTLPY